MWTCCDMVHQNNTKGQQPEWEAFWNDAAWDVEIFSSERRGFVTVNFLRTSTERSEIPVSCIRLRSTPLSFLDCPRLKEGMDVVAYAKHPAGKRYSEFYKGGEAWYDGRIVNIERNYRTHIPTGNPRTPFACTCQFSVMLRTSNSHERLSTDVCLRGRDVRDCNISRICLRRVPRVPYSHLLNWTVLGKGSGLRFPKEWAEDDLRVRQGDYSWKIEPILKDTQKLKRPLTISLEEDSEELLEGGGSCLESSTGRFSAIFTLADGFLESSVGDLGVSGRLEKDFTIPESMLLPDVPQIEGGGGNGGDKVRGARENSSRESPNLSLGFSFKGESKRGSGSEDSMDDFFADMAESDSEINFETEKGVQSLRYITSHQSSLHIDNKYIWCAVQNSGGAKRVHLAVESPYEERAICSVCQIALPFSLPFLFRVYDRMLESEYGQHSKPDSDPVAKQKQPDRTEKSETSSRGNGDEIRCQEIGEHQISDAISPVNLASCQPLVNGDLFPHQKEGLQFLLDRLANGRPENSESGCILAHAPGTGKTLTTIAFLGYCFSRNSNPDSDSNLNLNLSLNFKLCPAPTLSSNSSAYKTGSGSTNLKVLLVVPLSCLHQWTAEIKKWVPKNLLSAMDLKILDKRQKMVQNKAILAGWAKKGGILMTNYERLVMVGAEKLRFADILVCDEAHRVKNEKTKLWKTIHGLRAKRKLLITGTPVQNNLDELWTLLCLAEPIRVPQLLMEALEVPNRDQGSVSKVGFSCRMLFDARVAHPIERGEDVDEAKRAIQILKKLYCNFVHVDGGILHQKLPPLQDYTLVLNPTMAQMEAFSALRSTSNPNPNPSHQHMKLESDELSISAHPSIFLKKRQKTYSKRQRKRGKLQGGTCSVRGEGSYAVWSVCSLEWEEERSTKIMVLLELLSRYSTGCTAEKFIIFCAHLDNLDLVQKILRQKWGWRRGSEVFRLDGNMGEERRESEIRGFRETKSCKLILASIQVGGVGLNLAMASRVVLFDHDWNPAIMEQAVGRAWRQGQERTVTVYRLVMRGTREEAMFKTAASKQAMLQSSFFPKNRSENCQVGFENCWQEVSSFESEDAVLTEVIRGQVDGQDKTPVVHNVYKKCTLRL